MHCGARAAGEGCGGGHREEERAARAPSYFCFQESNGLLDCKEFNTFRHIHIHSHSHSRARAQSSEADELRACIAGLEQQVKDAVGATEKKKSAQLEHLSYF